MKKTKLYNNKVSILLLLMAALLTNMILSSCEDDKSEGGTPLVKYIRITDPVKSDSLVVKAFMGSIIAIVGENLSEVQEIWFNDQEAYINTSYVSDEAIIITIPNIIPEVVTDTMRLITSDGIETKHPFGVIVPPPFVSRMSLEQAKDLDTVTISGNYFIDDPSSPLQVIFPGNLPGTVLSVGLKEVVVTVPEGSSIGKVSVKSIYGSSRSSFIFRDDRINVLDYDELTNSGSWRSGTILNDENSIDGNYLMLKGTLDDNQGAEDFAGGGFVSELWSDANGRPEANFFTGDPNDYVIKFEANVVTWTGAYLNICFGPWASNVDGVLNQIYWGNINARALWRPWEDAGETSYKTDGWITVTIPMSEVKFNNEFQAMEFDPSIAGSMTLWMKGPSSEVGAQTDIEIYIDNVRIVEK